jgi:two-component system chemotaxis response regulator CheY
MQILIVDDSDTRLAQLRQILTEIGQDVAGTARDGLEAVERFRDLKPDAVIMDLIMPRMNGLDALRAMLRIDPRAIVVIASSMRSPESALECQRNGARYYLHKPFEPAVVRSVVEKLAAELNGRESSARDEQGPNRRAPD